MQEKKSSKNLRIRKVCVVGVIPSFAFQRAKFCALELHRKLPQRFPLPEIVGLLELDWSEKLQEWRQMFGREYWCLRRPVAVFFDNRFVGSDIELIKLISLSNILMDNIPRKDMSCLKQDFRRDYMSYLKKSRRIYCYLDICIDDVYAGTLTFRLYSDLLPRTCENFKTLCLGTRGPLLSYKGSRIHRIVKKGWLQGGDIQYKTGGGGFSIFCDPLEDECFGISHDKRGVLSMANAGRHKNGSQFFITLQPSKWMDTHFVAFGQLVEGGKILSKLENLETSYETPISKVEIKNCGKLDLGDVEDVDALYTEERMPRKKVKNIETIGNQIVRMIMEALTEALQRKNYPPDILDDGDVPSKMNLQLYFQGFYSLPSSILERTADYLRTLRRELFRLMKPSATEIVESLMYDLQVAIFTRMTDLDDMRETIGRDLYNKMIAGIDMTLEGCKKSCVKRLVDQIVTTAENMVELVTKKLLMMKRQSKKLKNFQDRMQMWVRSFVLQETFEGDNYFIIERPICPPKLEKEELPEGNVCCERERRKREEELKAKLRAKYAPEDLCCLGSELKLNDSEINFEDHFNAYQCDLKTRKERKERMPLLDLIEISRHKLSWLRRPHNQKKTAEMLCTEKNIRKWMAEISYTSETAWLRDCVFPRECRVLDHVEEIMYGAMTAGLLEMYYFMEEYLKTCGAKKKIWVTRTIYPDEDSLSEMKVIAEEKEDTTDTVTDKSARDQKSRARVKLPKEKRSSEEEGEGEEEEEEGEGGVGYGGVDGKTGTRPASELVPCPCGHPCCDCPFDPNQTQRKAVKQKRKKRKAKDYDEKKEGQIGGGGGRGGRGRGGEGGGGGGEGEGEGEEGGKLGKESKKDMAEGTSQLEAGASEQIKPCKSDETAVDLKVVMAQKLTTTADKIDINSFKWMKQYILEKGCDLKTEFATRVHQWIEGDQFRTGGLYSKHSLVTKASLLSLSLSLAELIKEKNNLKTGIKNFIYDLWNLYFEEMFKEALLEFPPEEEDKEGKGKGGDQDKQEEEEGEGGDEDDNEGEGKKGKRLGQGPRSGYTEDDDEEKREIEECRKLQELFKNFDFEKYCAKFREGGEEWEIEKELEAELENIQKAYDKYKTDAGTPGTSTTQKAKTPLTSAIKLPATPPTTTLEKDQTFRTSEPPTKSVQDQSEPPRKSLYEKSEAPRKSVKQQSEPTSPTASTHGQTPTSPGSTAGDIQSTQSSQHEMTDEEVEPETTVEVQAEEKRQKQQDSGKIEEQLEETRVPEKAEAKYTEGTKRRKSPIVVRELVEEPSGEEIRNMPPYVLPFWITFLTEMTKQALGAFARVSRLPRRLYLKSDSEMAFDDRMKEWFEFNAFNPQTVKGREVMDFIALHHKGPTNLEDTARSFLKKRKYSSLINRCTRIVSSDEVAGEIVNDTIQMSWENAKVEGGDETLELFVSDMLSSAIASSKAKSQVSFEGETEGSYSIPTDEKEPSYMEGEEDEEY